MTVTASSMSLYEIFSYVDEEKKQQSYQKDSEYTSKMM